MVRTLKPIRLAAKQAEVAAYEAALSEVKAEAASRPMGNATLEQERSEQLAGPTLASQALESAAAAELLLRMKQFEVILVQQPQPSPHAPSNSQLGVPPFGSRVDGC